MQKGPTTKLVLPGWSSLASLLAPQSPDMPHYSLLRRSGQVTHDQVQGPEPVQGSISPQVVPSGSDRPLGLHSASKEAQAGTSPGKPGSSTAPGYSYFSLTREARKVQASLSLLLLAISGEVCLPVNSGLMPLWGEWRRGGLRARSTCDLSCSWRESVTKGPVSSSVRRGWMALVRKGEEPARGLQCCPFWASWFQGRSI